MPVYEFDCIVIIDDKIEQTINKYLKRLGIEQFDDREQVHGYAVGTTNVHKYYIFYGLNSLTPNVITHEISHIVDYVFKDRSIEKSDTEVRAYLTGYICQKIFDFVLKKNLLISKWLPKKQIVTVQQS